MENHLLDPFEMFIFEWKIKEMKLIRNYLLIYVDFMFYYVNDYGLWVGVNDIYF